LRRVTAPDATAAVLQALLLYAVLPLWMLAGFGDWLCHRVQRIEHTTGTKESLLHLALIAELGIGVAAVLLLHVNAAVLLIALGCCIAHEFTTWWDLAYASSIRRIPVPEQWVHSVQLAIPWVGLFTLAVIHRDQALAIVGSGPAAPDWALRWKEPPLPAPLVAAAFAGAALVVVMPFLQEWRRCARAAKRPEQAREL
jgi:hypothetical protein